MKNRKKRGFTLTEVLVAVLILSLSLAGLAAVYTTGIKQTSVSSNKVEAISHLNETLGRLAGYVADEPFGPPEDDTSVPVVQQWFTSPWRSPGWQCCGDGCSAWGNCYALEAGIHTVRLIPLVDRFASVPVGGKVWYVVENNDPAAGWKKVAVHASWNEP